MPNVDGKKFPYTPEGKKAAKKAMLKKAVSEQAGQGGPGFMDKKEESMEKGAMMGKYSNLKKK